MSSTQAAIVFAVLRSDEWKRQSSGSIGELWVKSGNVVAVPFDLEVGSPEWIAIVNAVSLDRGVSAASFMRNLRTLERGSSMAGRVELDLHLEGASVKEHETDAYAFGQFVTGWAESVKEFVKSARGITSYSRSLVVAGGVKPGSVRVVLREPERRDKAALLPDPPASSEAEAMSLLATLCNTADAHTGDAFEDNLSVHLGPLTLRARQQLARLARTQMRGGWDVFGTLRRQGEEIPVTLTQGGAQYLYHASRSVKKEESQETLTGELDGWTWSSAELLLLPDDRSGIRVAVPMSLQSEVATLNAERGTRVRARLAVYRSLSSMGGDTVRSQYSLLSISRVDEQTKMVQD